jgi:hypothetical protein
MQTVNDVAVQLNVSTRRVRQLCEQGRIAGARRIIVEGDMPLWELPDVIAIKPGKRGPKLGVYRSEP